MAGAEAVVEAAEAEAEDPSGSGLANVVDPLAGERGRAGATGPPTLAGAQEPKRLDVAPSPMEPKGRRGSSLLEEAAEEALA